MKENNPTKKTWVPYAVIFLLTWWAVTSVGNRNHAPNYNEIRTQINARMGIEKSPNFCTEVALVKESDARYSGYATFDNGVQRPLQYVQDASSGTFYWQLN